MDTPAILQGIEDNALYPGHVVRQMLDRAGHYIPATAWLTTVEAAGILGISSDYVRKRCAVWAEQAHPVVRVRKTSAADNAHWRLAEPDVYDLARKRGATVDPEVAAG